MLHSRIIYPKNNQDTERNGSGKNAVSVKNGSNGKKSSRTGIHPGKSKKADIPIS